MARCRDASRPRSRCSMPAAPAWCSRRFTTALRPACTPSRCGRASRSSSSRRRRARRSGSRSSADAPTDQPRRGPGGTMRVGYFGPEGTFTHEALIDAVGGAGRPDLPTPEPVPLPTIYDTVMAVHAGTVELALVPIENSLEGSVNATLDALAIETDEVAIVGEVVHPIRHC